MGRMRLKKGEGEGGEKEGRGEGGEEEREGV